MYMVVAEERLSVKVTLKLRLKEKEPAMGQNWGPIQVPNLSGLKEQRMPMHWSGGELGIF